MLINLHKLSHLIFFVVILGGLSIGVAFLFHILLPNPQWWLETISPLAAYGILYSWFDKHLWKLGVFRVTGIVCFPNLNGRWEGIQRSSYKDVNSKQVELNTVLEIKQTFSKIVIKAYYEKSKSESVVAHFAELNDEVYLYYTYDSDPNTLKERTMAMHKGSVKIKHLSKDNMLCGFYFNSIKNEGDIELRFTSKELKGRY